MDQPATGPKPRPIAGQALLIVAALVVVIAGLKLAAPVMVPLCLAVLISILVAPSVLWLEKRRVPGWLAVLLVSLAMMMVFIAFGALLTASVADFLEAMPEYRQSLRKLSAESATWLRDRNVTVTFREIYAMVDPERLIDYATRSLEGLIEGLTNTFVVLLTMVFILLEVAGFPRKLRKAMGDPNADLGDFRRMVTEVHRYLQIKTVISLATGLLTSLWVWMFGLQFAPLWGLIAFLLNYIPNVGPLIAAVPAVLIGLATIGLAKTAGVALGYVLIHIVVGNIIEPEVMGRRLGLSPLVVFVALVLWGWLWGPVGMLLSVPLTMIFKIMFEESPRYGWISVLLDLPPALDQLRPPGVRSTDPTPPGPP